MWPCYSPRNVMLALLFIMAAAPAHAFDPCATPAAICPTAGTGGLALITGGRAVRVTTDPRDDPGVARAARDLAQDLRNVGGDEAVGPPALAVIVGTLGHNAVIDRLAADGFIDRKKLAGKWETFLEQVVDHPAPGIDRALVVAGSDRRGAIFGAYDISRRAGVSPWTWWADVPVHRHTDLAVARGSRVEGPAVKYRGIFLNDEDPALSGWATARYGGLNHKFYAHVFDLVLRLKGNMIWPAMWGKSLWDDDPESAALAQQMGIILGTSHEEPMMRATVEWQRHGTGPWNYATNGAQLRAFWREGLKRAVGRDSIVTIGMRGDGDKPMTRGTAIPLLKRIVRDQRTIIADTTGKPARETPQVWALYKEVQDYYDKGMRVPDDVTLLFSDDNWGDIRRLPAPGTPRAGGYGVYYHFDYVGGPRSYKWINTVQVSHVWQQMNLALAHGADRLWVVNVGDLKPMELPISFFLDYAWQPSAWPVERIGDYDRAWAAEQFGDARAATIGEVIDRTQRYIARRTPELLSPDSWSQAGWNRILGEYGTLEKDAERIAATLPASMHDAYFELVLHPVLAMANLDRLYATVAANRRCAAIGDPQANVLADAAGALFDTDKTIAARYEASAGGKWPHMMDQTHIGYSGWNDPKVDIMPAVRRVDRAGQVADSGCGLEPIAPQPAPRAAGAFVERGGSIVIDAVHAAGGLASAGASWREIPQLGRGGSAMAVFPQDATVAAPGEGAMLDYDVDLVKAGAILAQVIAAPSLDVSGAGRLRYAIAIDSAAPQTVNLIDDGSKSAWSESVIAGARVGASHFVVGAGHHRIHIWMVDPGVVIERIVLTRAPIDPLALDQPESGQMTRMRGGDDSGSAQ